MRRKIVQQAKLQSAEFDVTSRNADSMRGWIDVDIAMLQRVALRHGILAPQQGAHTGDQFAHAEGFRDVVVGAEFEPDHPVGLFAARSQHQDRSVGISFMTPDLAADLQPVHSRKHQIQDDQVRGSRRISASARLPSVTEFTRNPSFSRL